MKKFLLLLLTAIVASAVWAQTNAVVKKSADKKSADKKPADQEVGATAAQMFYYQNNSKLIYLGNVIVTNVQGNLTCARLTIDLPPQGSTNNQVTNAVAETNVIINIFKDGDTNHITCDRAVYAYSVVNAVTNQTITFIGSSNNPAKLENSKESTTGEPLVWDNVNKQFLVTNPKSIVKMPADAGSNSNSTPFGVPK